MRFKLTALALTVLFLSAVNSFAAKKGMEWEQKISKDISKMTKMTTENVDELKMMHGYAGTILIAEISKQAKRPHEVIMADRGTGMDWDDIIEKYKLSEKDIRKKAKKMLMSLKKDFKTENYTQAMNVIKDID